MILYDYGMVEAHYTCAVELNGGGKGERGERGDCEEFV